MENHFRAVVALGIALTINSVAGAGEIETASRDVLSGLDILEQTYGPSASRCNLGFLGFGSPVIVTRVSPWKQNGGLTEADRLLAINGAKIEEESDLHIVLDSVEPDEEITLSVLRGKETIEIETHCREAAPILRAHEEALVGASEGRWDQCIRATYLEEIHWGGANSQSAGLRLWCHQARALKSHALQVNTSSLTRLHAQLIYEYANLLLEELQYVPGGLDDLRATLRSRIQQIADSSHRNLYTDVTGRIGSMNTL